MRCASDLRCQAACENSKATAELEHYVLPPWGAKKPLPHLLQQCRERLNTHTAKLCCRQVVRLLPARAARLLPPKLFVLWFAHPSRVLRSLRLEIAMAMLLKMARVGGSAAPLPYLAALTSLSPISADLRWHSLPQLLQSPAHPHIRQISWGAGEPDDGLNQVGMTSTIHCPRPTGVRSRLLIFCWHEQMISTGGLL